MSETQGRAAHLPLHKRYGQALDLYMIALSVVMMLFGLRQWAVIVGLLTVDGMSFEGMSTAWKILTMHFAVVDLVAAVGLWMRVSWGKVVWIYAAASEIIVHTAFIGTYGSDLPKVTFHIITLLVFLVMTFLDRRYGNG